MNNLAKLTLLCAAMASATSAAQADSFVLDTAGLPTTSNTLILDSNDFVAAEFTLGDGEIITSIQADLIAGDSGVIGSAITFSIYSVDATSGLPSRFGQLYSGNTTFTGDGWNTLSNVGLSGLSAGNYWVTVETASNDTNLQLPIFANNGTAPAISEAFSSNGGNTYIAMSGENFGIQVAAVPVPPSLLLFASGLAALGLRKRQAA